MLKDKPPFASSPASQIPERGESLIRWYRFLDWLQSAWRRSRKALTARRRYGEYWQDKVRSGRHYTRVWFDDVDLSADPTRGIGWKLRAEPGWEWTCQNCKTRSLVTDSMVAIYTINGTEYRDDMLKQWEELATSTAARGYKPPAKPTPATAPCPNCRYRPGAPE